ncbi:hypothetical protein F5X98DRAFT_374540 [Xylaria grammica]|nr:hypothetical protein F5X98DRAFT_374540 [Xylaria grammica]
MDSIPSTPRSSLEDGDFVQSAIHSPVDSPQYFVLPTPGHESAFPTVFPQQEHSESPAVAVPSATNSDSGRAIPNTPSEEDTAALLRNQYACRRRATLSAFRTAHKLHVQSECEVLVIVSHRYENKLHVYCTEPSEDWPPPYQKIKRMYPMPELFTPSNLGNLFKHSKPRWLSASTTPAVQSDTPHTSSIQCEEPRGQLALGVGGNPEPFQEGPLPLGHHSAVTEKHTISRQFPAYQDHTLSRSHQRRQEAIERQPMPDIQGQPGSIIVEIPQKLKRQEPHLRSPETIVAARNLDSRMDWAPSTLESPSPSPATYDNRRLVLAHDSPQPKHPRQRTPRKINVANNTPRTPSRSNVRDIRRANACSGIQSEPNRPNVLAMPPQRPYRVHKNRGPKQLRRNGRFVSPKDSSI